MTDNGPCFYSHRLRSHLRDLQLRTSALASTPRTNGKAERFIQTAIREWAYARLYQNSAQRLCHLASPDPSIQTGIALTPPLNQKHPSPVPVSMSTTS